MKTNLSENLVNKGINECDNQMLFLIRRMKSKRTIIHILIGATLLMAFLMTLSFITKPKVIVNEVQWLPLGYCDWKAMTYAGDLVSCWPEDSVSASYDTIVVRADRLNDFIEGHHDLISRGILIHIQDLQFDLQEQYCIRIVDHDYIDY